MKKYVELDSLWKCETCFWHSGGKCSPRIWCDCGESYRPAYGQLKILEGEFATEAHWLINPDGYYPYCSNCKSEPKSGIMTKFCSECGAKMV